MEVIIMAGLKKSTQSTDEIAKVVDTIEEENVAELSDVAVAEDGYVHDEDLLCGYTDPNTGLKHTTFTYREMNGKDEEAINKSDIRANGARLVNV